MNSTDDGIYAECFGGGPFVIGVPETVFFSAPLTVSWSEWSEPTEAHDLLAITRDIARSA